jgi:UDP-N-acetylmuramate dehydrogenase
LVIKIDLKGVEYKDTDAGTTLVSAAAGEMWDDLVAAAVERGLYGMENLSAIPGTVGAVPVQNIGAYGAEASQIIKTVRALDTNTLAFIELRPGGCHFAYRDSVFKHLKGRYIISKVNFELSKKGKVNISYKDLQDYFAEKKIATPTLDEVRHAVVDIRWGKLPDWKLWGTAGSFFKNPVLDADAYAKLRARYPGLPGYVEPDGRVKVSLAWILDKVCDVKGMCRGQVCTYEKQALVVVAQPGATSAEVVELTHELMMKVKEKTGIEVEAEVEWVN